MQTHSPKKNSLFRATLAYVMALIFVVETSIPAWAQTPSVTPAATTTATAAVTPTGSGTPFIPGSNPNDTVDRSRLQTNPLATGTPSPRSKELAEKVKADMAADPNLETEARIKFNKNKSAIDKATEDEIAKINKNKNLSKDQKDLEIQKAKARQDRAVLVEKEKFAKDLGFDNFHQVKEAGIGDPTEGGPQKRSNFTVADAYLNPATYLEYILVLAAGFLGPVILRSCYPEGCPSVSQYIAAISLIAYALGEILYMFQFKKTSEEKMKIDRDKNFDSQTQAMKKAKEITESAAKAAKMKSIILSVASAGLWAAAIAAMIEAGVYETGCASVIGSAYFCKCKARDLTCESAAADLNYENLLKERTIKPGSDYLFYLTNLENNKDYLNLKAELISKDQSITSNLFKAQMRKADSAETAYMVFNEWVSLKQGGKKSSTLDEWIHTKKFIQLSQMLDQDGTTGAQVNIFKSEALTQLMDYEEIINRGNFLDNFVSQAHAGDNGKLGMAAALGLGVILAAVFLLVKQTVAAEIATMFSIPWARIVWMIGFAAAASSTAAMTVVASNDLQEQADKYGDIEDELEQLKKLEGQVEQSIGGKPNGAALIAKAATSYKDNKIKEGDYSDLPKTCFKFTGGGKEMTPDESCSCKEKDKCAKVEAPKANSNELKGFDNTLGSVNMASDKNAQLVNSLGQGDLNGAASTGIGVGRLAASLRKKADEFKKHLDDTQFKGKDSIDKQVSDFRHKLFKQTDNIMKKNNVDLAKELGNRLGAPSAESESQKDIAEMTEKKAAPAAPAIDLSGLGGGMPAMPKDLDAADDVAAPVPEVAATPDNSEYELNSNADVVQDSGVSIWQVLSVRYIKTAMPSLLEEKASSDHPPLVPQGQQGSRGPQGVPEQGLPQEAPQNEATEATQGAPAGTTEVTLPPGGAQLKEEDKLGVESNF